MDPVSNVEEVDRRICETANGCAPMWTNWITWPSVICLTLFGVVLTMNAVPLVFWPKPQGDFQGGMDNFVIGLCSLITGIFGIQTFRNANHFRIVFLDNGIQYGGRNSTPEELRSVLYNACSSFSVRLNPQKNAESSPLMAPGLFSRLIDKWAGNGISNAKANNEGRIEFRVGSEPKIFAYGISRQDLHEIAERASEVRGKNVCV